MIITVTPNPSLDRTLELDHLVRGALNRAAGVRVDPGGKGVNVSRALAAHGLKTTAVLPLGGAGGVRLGQLLTVDGIEVRAVPVAAGVRTNITLAEPDGTTTKLNEPGPQLRTGEVEALRRAVLDEAAAGTWVVCCGSLPRGVAPDFFASLVGPLHRRGARVAVDTSGDALRAVLSAGRSADQMPDLVKPNHDELAEAVARPLATLGDVVLAAAELRDRGVGAALVSLGADGAVLVDGAGAAHAEARVGRPRSTVGAGDALLAGFLFSSGSTRGPAAGCTAGPAEPAPAGSAVLDDARRAREALVAALAWGAAATCLPGSRMPGPADVAAVAVTLHHRCDPQRRLEGAPQ
ncbi:MAG TPA: 1-phosphofructokinase [Kineosporiaceae bacterium]